MLHENMLCPVCEEGYLNLIHENVGYTYKGHVTQVDTDLLKCPVCGESFILSPTERELEKLLTDERRKVDGLLTSDEIREIRHNLGLTQVELAKTLGVGEKNFARYENGQATQGRAMDALLRVFKDCPAMIKTLVYSQAEENISTEVSFTISVMKKKRSSKAVKVSSSGDFNFKEGFCNAAGF